MYPFIVTLILKNGIIEEDLFFIRYNFYRYLRGDVKDDIKRIK